MTGIKNALKFLWGLISGMAIVQVCYCTTALNRAGFITNGWSFTAWGIIYASGIAIIIVVVTFLADHWNDK